MSFLIHPSVMRRSSGLERQRSRVSVRDERAHDDVRGRTLSGPSTYILRVKRTSIRAVVLLAGTTMCAAAQRAEPPDTLSPRAWVSMAIRAKGADSVAAREADWRAASARAPQAPGPRFALGVLARYDQRYQDSKEWLDSAAAVAGSPSWRSAINRERVTGMIAHGEFSAIREILSSLEQDSASIKPDEWAESRYVRTAYRRRLGGSISSAELDSISGIAAPSDTLLMAKVSCLRAAVDPARRIPHAEAGIALADAAGALSISASCALVVGTQFLSGAAMRDGMPWLDRAERAARKAHDLPTLAMALQWHGSALASMGYTPWATARLAEAIRIAQLIDDRSVEAWALLAVANSAALIGDASAASRALGRASALFEATGDVYGSANARALRANAQIQLGDLDGALTTATRTRALGDSLSQPGLSLRSIYTMANVAMRRHKFDAAATMLDSASARVRGMGPAFSRELAGYRGIHAVSTGRNVEAVNLLLVARHGYAADQELFRSSIDGALALAWIRRGDTTQSARLLRESNDALDRLRDSVASENMRRVVMPSEAWGGAASFVDQTLAGLVQSRTWLPAAFALTERARARALAKGSFGVVGSDTAPEVIAARQRVRATATSLAAVQRAMRPGTALLVYAGGLGEAPTSLIVVTRSTARGLTLAPLDSLGRDIVRWLALLESGERAVGAGKRVAAAVLSTALRNLPQGITRLVIVPQGAIYRVPFQALPVASGVLGDRVVVTISPSVSLAMAYAAEPRAVVPSVLALGAGDTEVASFTPSSLQISSDRSNPLTALPAAADEARAAAAWGIGSLALTGTNASESALKRESRGAFTILHTAAHALTSDQALGANWLILRPDSTNDGYVSGGELAELSAGRAMVVLSGCRTTGDFGSRGDAIDGLVAPLLARGVRTVVASHWAVSDRWTQVLMERFYRHLATGATTAEAMNLAQTSLRRSGVPARFWAAFSVIGDGSLIFLNAPAVQRTTGTPRL